MSVGTFKETSNTPFLWTMASVSSIAHSGAHADGSHRELKDKVAKIVLSRVETGALPLPSIPLAALACFDVLRKPEFSMHEAARVIGQDPALALRVLSVSHSAAFRAKHQAQSLIAAVTQLGAEKLRLVLYEAVAAPIYESNDRRIRAACLALWRHSRAVANAARTAAFRARAGNPGEAYLAGLLHDVGKPMVASLLIGSEQRLVGKQTALWLNADVWLDLVQDIHKAAGVALARKWELADVIAQAIAATPVEGSIADGMVACVGLANAMAKDAGIYAGCFDQDAVRETIRANADELGLGSDDLAAMRMDLYPFIEVE